jgi:hypothetical protein
VCQGWLDNEPEVVPDTDVAQPEDWDEEEDGEWEAPMVPVFYYVWFPCGSVQRLPLCLFKFAVECWRPVGSQPQV